MSKPLRLLLCNNFLLFSRCSHRRPHFPRKLHEVKTSNLLQNLGSVFGKRGCFYGYLIDSFGDCRTLPCVQLEYEILHSSSNAGQLPSGLPPGLLPQYQRLQDRKWPGTLRLLARITVFLNHSARQLPEISMMEALLIKIRVLFVGLYDAEFHGSAS